MQTAQLRHEIRFFIAENFLYGMEGADLQDTVSFLANGLIDSTGVLELVAFVENKYGVSVRDDELIPDNFDSVENLMNFIIRKVSDGAGCPGNGGTVNGEVTASCVNIPS